MAALAVQFAFAAAGNALLGSAPVFLGLSGAGIGSLVGSAVGAFLFPGPDVNTKGPRLTEKSVTSSSYGVMIPIVYGTAPVPGNIIDASEIYEKSHKETSGGKGGPSVSYTTYTYSVDLAVALCVGPISGVLQIYANEKLIYDATPGTNITKPNWLDFRVYTGTETQEPDTTLEAIHGAGNVPAYRGMAYVVFTQFQLEEFGNRPPTFRFIVVSSGTKTDTETIIDISEDGGTSSGPTYVQKTGLIYASVTQGSYDERAFVAIDPFSKNIIWGQDGRDIALTGIWVANTQPPQLCGANNSWDSLDSTPYLAVTGRQSSGGTSRRMMFINAKTGVIEKIVTLTSTVDRVMKFLSLFENHMSFLYAGSSTPIGASMHTITWGSWSQNYGVVNPPTDGGSWGFHGNFIWGVKQGRVTLQGDSFVTTSPCTCCAWITRSSGTIDGIAVWTHYFYASPPATFNPNYTVHDLGSGSITEINDIKYDSERDCFWAYCRADNGSTDYIEVIKIPADGTDIARYNWNTEYGMTRIARSTYSTVFGDDFLNGYIWIEDTGGKLWKWDIVNLTAPVEYTATTINKNMTYIPATQSMWGASSDKIIEYQNDRLTSNTVSLSSIVDDLLDRVGLEAADYDTSDLDAIDVRGYVIGNQMSARAALEPLRVSFLFDHADTGSQITFVPLGQSVTKALVADDIGAHAWGEAPAPLIQIDRAKEIDLPKELSISYMDIGANYEVGQQRARALATKSNQTISVEMPIVLTHGEAAQKSEILLHLARIERESYKIQAMPAHYDLIPSNVITVNDGTSDFRMRIREKITERGIIKLGCVRDENAVFTSSAAGAEITGRTVSVQIRGIMQYELLDLPALRDEDMTPGFYVAGYSYTPNWPGGVIYRSTDQSTWAENVVVPSATTIGRAWNKANSAVAERWDDTNSLSMSMYSGSLESKTRAEVLLSGVNVAAYGASGRWEIVQFASATLGADGLYTVSEFLRGRLGTDAYVTTHDEGDLFILLDTDTIRRISSQQSEIGSSFYYRGVTIGASLYDTTNIDALHTHVGPGLLCYAPAHFNYYKEADLDVVFTWDERTRQIWTNFWSGVSSDPGDYEIDIYDGASVVLTISSSSETATFSRTDQETYFGPGTTDTIDVILYQVNSIGRGHGAELSVTLG